MVVLPRYISAGNRPADGPPLRGGRSAVISVELKQNHFFALFVVQSELRTVRVMGADGPPLNPETGAETWSFCIGCPNVLRTVRPLGADGPPPTKNSETETLRFLCVLTF